MDDQSESRVAPDIEARIVEMHDAGASWKAVQEQFGLTRQQARHAYQRGKRTERRAARRSGSATAAPRE